MMIHELKVWPWYFRMIAEGRQALEIRFGDDRKYEGGDLLLLREWDREEQAYTGRWLTAGVALWERLEPAWFGAQGDTVWVLTLEAVGAIQVGWQAAWGPSTITMGLAPAGVTSFAACAAWPCWVPISGADVAYAHAQPNGQYVATVRGVRGGTLREPLAAWVAACEGAEAGCARLVAVRFELEAGPGRVVRYIPLTHVVVARARPGVAPCDYEALELVCGLAGERS